MKVDTSNPAVIHPLGPGSSSGLRKTPQSAMMKSDHQLVGHQAVSIPGSKPCASATYAAQGRMVDVYETIARSSPPEPIVKSIDASGGRDLMVNRLFGGQEPKVFDGSKGLTMENACRSNYVYLTHQDRELFSDIYAYADAHDIDLTHVDWVASDIGDYRRHDNGRSMLNFNDGGSYDIHGWQQKVGFNDKDAAIASRLLSGTVLGSTRFDQGFLRYILDPGYGALGHTGQFEFLEHVVNRFSAEADTTLPAGNRFSQCIAPAMGENYVIVTSLEVRKQRVEPDVIIENGVARLTAKGKSLGIKLDGTDADDHSLATALVRLRNGIELLRERDEHDYAVFRSGRLRSFWKELFESRSDSGGVQGFHSKR